MYYYTLQVILETIFPAYLLTGAKHSLLNQWFKGTLCQLMNRVSSTAPGANTGLHTAKLTA